MYWIPTLATPSMPGRWNETAGSWVDGWQMAKMLGGQNPPILEGSNLMQIYGRFLYNSALFGLIILQWPFKKHVVQLIGLPPISRFDSVWQASVYLGVDAISDVCNWKNALHVRQREHSIIQVKISPSWDVVGMFGQLYAQGFMRKSKFHNPYCAEKNSD